MSSPPRTLTLCSSEKTLKLNVGGTIFQTTRATLTKYDSMLRTMLESDIPVELDSSGCIFIDRDPTHFRYILNFMRDGNVELPENLKDVKEIMKEVQFYSVEGLVDVCHDHIVKEEVEMLRRQSSDTEEFLKFGASDSEILRTWLSSKKMVVVYKGPKNCFNIKFDDYNYEWLKDWKVLRGIMQKYKDDFKFFINEDPKRKPDSEEWTSHYFSSSSMKSYGPSYDSTQFFRMEDQRLAQLKETLQGNNIV